jgi:hypothetical protein
MPSSLKKALGSLEVVDDDEDVVHPLNRHGSNASRGALRSPSAATVVWMVIGLLVLRSS